MVHRSIILVAALTGAAGAQLAPSQPFIAGRAMASVFSQWTAGAQALATGGGAGSVSPDVPSFTAPGGYAFTPFAAGVPIAIGDGANSETVTILSSNCAIGSNPCTFTANFAHTHLGRVSIGSGSGGLQEAIDAMKTPGGSVVVTPDWRGTTAMITGASGNSNVEIVDERTGVTVWYGWTGSAYAPAFCINNPPSAVNCINLNGASISNPNIANPTMSGGSLSGAAISGGSVSGAAITASNANLTTPTISSATVNGTVGGSPTITSLTATHPAISPTAIENVQYADQFGASGSDQRTTGSIGAASHTLALAAAMEFKNGEGIAVAHAGTAAGKATPTGLSASATVPAWSASTTFAVGIQIDDAGGNIEQVTSCSGACISKSGLHPGWAGSPGGTTIDNNITWTREGTGLVTWTYCLAATDGLGGISACTSHVTAQNVGALTFGHPGATAAAYNELTWTSNAAPAYVVYSDSGSGNGGLDYVGASHINSWYDGGQYPAITAFWPFVPLAAPASALAQTLVTSITNGGGSNSLTLAAAATTAVTSQPVLHDDSVAVQACLAGGSNLPCYLPAGTYNFTNTGLMLSANQTVYGSYGASTLQCMGAGACVYTEASSVVGHDFTVMLDDPSVGAALEVDGESSSSNRDTFFNLNLGAYINTYQQSGMWLHTGNGNFANYDNSFENIRTSRIDLPIFLDSPFSSSLQGYQSPNLNTFTNIHAAYESTCADIRDGAENSFANVICLQGYGVPQYRGFSFGDAFSVFGAEYNRANGVQCDQNSGYADGVCAYQATPGGILDNFNQISMHDADTTVSTPGNWASNNAVENESGAGSFSQISTPCIQLNNGPWTASGCGTGNAINIGAGYINLLTKGQGITFASGGYFVDDSGNNLFVAAKGTAHLSSNNIDGETCAASGPNTFCNFTAPPTLPGIYQPVAKEFAGTCAMSSATTCTATISLGFNSPVCIATEQGAGAIAASCGVSGTTVTITAASSNSATWGFWVFGNPNSGWGQGPGTRDRPRQTTDDEGTILRAGYAGRVERPPKTGIPVNKDSR